jgi:hypothetical protein
MISPEWEERDDPWGLASREIRRHMSVGEVRRCERTSRSETETISATEAKRWKDDYGHISATQIRRCKDWLGYISVTEAEEV